MYSDAVKTIDELKISPPPGCVPATSLPLTFLDITWLLSRPVQLVFFYNLPLDTNNASQFRQIILPGLTSSLSLALRYFYPFAARLIAPTRPGKPCILYSEGDSVPLTFAETSLDFDQATTHLPNDVVYLHPLLPKLPPAEVKPDGTTVSPLLAVKITLFPNSGVCIGFEFSHVAADGSSFSHFVRSWASICKSGGTDLSWVEKSPPCLDRSLIKDPRNLENIFLEQIGDFKEPPREDDLDRSQFSGKARATFVVDREDIARLKTSVNFPVSAFAAASAFLWTILMKSLALEEAEDECEKMDTYLFAADFRSRLEPKLPATYFGNCVAGSAVSVKRSELLGDEGFVAAAKAIADAIQGIGGALGDMEKWMSGMAEILKLGKLVAVAGSPRERVYETDFWWGRPKKAGYVLGVSGSVYLSDPRDEERGGLEFGLLLPKPEMDAFVALFEQRLKQLREREIN